VITTLEDLDEVLGLDEVLSLDFSAACDELAEARLRQSRKDTPDHREAVAAARDRDRRGAGHVPDSVIQGPANKPLQRKDVV